MSYRDDLAEQIPTYRISMHAHAEAITEHGAAQLVRDGAADDLDDARARALAEEKPGDLAQPKDQRAALLHVRLLSALNRNRSARDGHTTAATVMSRTQTLERGEREILKSLRVLVGGDGE
jgi:hypothetical protein